MGGVHFPGRWHDQGHRVVYTSTSVALACIESALHSRVRPSDSMLAEIDLVVSPTRVEDLIGGPLPRNWPADHAHTRPIGTKWLIDKTSVALSVPSIAVPLETNILLNPEHANFAHEVRLVRCEPFFFDPRLFK
jgi:RES domain-containing protein